MLGVGAACNNFCLGANAFQKRDRPPLRGFASGKRDYTFQRI